ncbi:hypothetical protein [Nostoc sp. ChiVER01]|uniref:hypothetical protein n=1 Tax=Nostoc sp. ChiVER01 TaxID=3075382 RepID=UPI002AD57BAD|nr:hypothetical protein [Nostoc sp. ChiVER01]MDZ8227030.1 hypothetical protein [Nostoc sp. ChiVER01]
MKRQTIYIALALSPETRALVALCWHIDQGRAGDVGTALCQQNGLSYFGVTSCENADFEADSRFPDDHWLNAKR